MDSLLSVSLVTVDGKIHSSNVYTSISALCSLTIQPQFPQLVLVPLKYSTIFVQQCEFCM